MTVMILWIKITSKIMENEHFQHQKYQTMSSVASKVKYNLITFKQGLKDYQLALMDERS